MIFKVNKSVHKVRVVFTLCRNCMCNSKAFGLEPMSNVDTRIDAKKIIFRKSFVASSEGSLSALSSSDFSCRVWKPRRGCGDVWGGGGGKSLGIPMVEQMQT